MKKHRGIVTRADGPSSVLNVLRQKGLARTRDFERAGVSRTQLRRLVIAGTLENAGRGLYRLPNARRSAHDDLTAAARLVPGGTVCLLSALRFHGLTTQNPFEVWLAIPQKAWRPRVSHPPLRLIFLSGAALTEGVEQHVQGGVPIKVYSAAKTVADCFKFRNKLGMDVALEALREYRRAFPRRQSELWHYAQVDRVARVMRPYLEALA